MARCEAQLDPKRRCMKEGNHADPHEWFDSRGAKGIQWWTTAGSDSVAPGYGPEKKETP